MCPPKAGKNAPPPPPPEPVAPPVPEETSILNFDPLTCVAPPEFTDALTVQAMLQTGIAPEDLVRLPKEYIRKIPGKPAMRERIVKELEDRRLEAVSIIKSAREELVKQQKQKEAFARKYKFPDSSAAGDRELRRQERMQQREVELLIAAELRRQMDREQEIERQRHLEEIIQQQEALRKKALAEEAAKRKEREAKVIARLAQLEVEYEEAKRKAEEHEERRKKAKEEQQQKLRADALKLEKEKDKRRAKLLELQQQKEIEMVQRKEEVEIELQKRAAERLKAKEDEFRRAKELHETLMKKQRERVAESHRKEEEAVEQRVAKFEENERLVLQRVAESQRKRDEAMLQMKKRNEAKVVRARTMIDKIFQDDLEKKQAIGVKTTEAAARLQIMITEKNRRIAAARKGEGEKAAQALERKTRSEEIFAQRLGNTIQKQEATESRLADLKKKSEDDSLQRAADSWLKVHISEDNAKRLARREEYERQQTLKKMEDQASHVAALTDQKREEEAKRKKKSAALAEQKKKLLAEFQARMEGKGEPNIEGLAREFGIDVEAMKTRIRNPDRTTAASSKLSDRGLENP
jgi:hypothetical protein